MKLKLMAGTLSIAMMLATPTLTQANVSSVKSLVPLKGSSEIIGLKAWAKALDIDITGLTNDQARSKIKSAERANTLTRLLAEAKTLGIGIK